jgi:hypothetical protein
MRLYKVNWYVNDEMFLEKEYAYWADSELTESLDNQIRGIEDMIRYEYKFIQEIKLPNLF